MNSLYDADTNASSDASEITLRRAYSASEWRIIPLLFLLWLLAWVDRANVAFAKLQMLSDLHFSETVYGLGAGLFFLGTWCSAYPVRWLSNDSAQDARFP
jgi:sugar phosphate permease